MKTLPTLTFSAMKMFVRNRQALFFTLFMPTIIMTVFGLIGFDRVPKIPVGLVSSAPNPATGQFIEGFKRVPAFDIHEGSETEERAAIAEGDRSMVVIVPDNLVPQSFGPQTQPEQMTVLANAGEQQQAQTAQTILNQLLDKTTMAAMRTPNIFNLHTEEINARNLKYIDFLLPGIVALAIMQMSVFSVAFVFVDYKEKGILKRLLATPMRPYQFVTANVITRILVGLAQSIILIAIGVLIFKAHVIGSYLLVLLTVLLGSVMFLGLGFTISGLASTVESVPAIANLIVFPMLFLGGTFFPTTSMPDWLQHIVKYLPLTFFSHALREVTTKGSGIVDIRWDMLWMLIWSVIFILLAIKAFGFEEKRI